MVYVGLILTLFIAGSANGADFEQAGGAQHHHQHAQENEYNVDEMIRAEEDPNFEQYLKDREREKKEEKAARLEYEKQRRAEEAAQYKAYMQYLKEKHERAAREKKVKPKNYVDETKIWREQQEKFRQEYLKKQAQEDQKHEAERMARIQKAMSLERMPASE
jgi:hypothetical protein